MSKLQKLVLTVLFFISFQTNCFAEEPSISKQVAVYKLADWLIANYSIKNVSLEVNEDRKFEKTELAIKILKILEQEKPNSLDSYKILTLLINGEIDIARANVNRYIETIELLITDQILKDELINLLDDSNHPRSVNFDVKIQNRGFSILQVLKDIRTTFDNDYLPVEIKKKLIGSVDTIKSVLLDSIPEDDCYNTSADCQFSSNRGLIHYYSKRIQENHILALTVFKVGIRIMKLNQKYSKELAIGPKYSDVAKINIWGDILDAAGGDKVLAMEAVSVFGHDVCCNGLSYKDGNNFLTSILNYVSYSKYGNDTNPSSVLFLPGSLGGVLPDKKIVRELDNAIKNYDVLFNSKFNLRNGYHHVIGGMLMANELNKRGNAKLGTIELSSLISQAMGYAYKKLQLPTYLSPDASSLWIKNNSNEFAKIEKPEDWDELRFKKAKAEVKLQIAILNYTENQHFVGAQFAMKQYY